MGIDWAPCNLTLGERYVPHGSGRFGYDRIPRELVGAIWVLIASGRWSHDHEIRLLSDACYEWKLDPETFSVVGSTVVEGIGEDAWYELREVRLEPVCGVNENDDRDSHPPEPSQ